MFDDSEADDGMMPFDLHDVAGGRLKFAAVTVRQFELMQSILDFTQYTKDIEIKKADDSRLTVRQGIDGHLISISAEHLDDVLMRYDVDGRAFIQINFQDGLKILITDRLIGFKPVLKKDSNSKYIKSHSVQGANLLGNKLPKVVTTPDLLSVLEAMEDVLDETNAESHDFTVLRELFESIVLGAERAGFNVEKEKAWLLPFMSLPPGLRANA